MSLASSSGAGGPDGCAARAIHLTTACTWTMVACTLAPRRWTHSRAGRGSPAGQRSVRFVCHRPGQFAPDRSASLRGYPDGLAAAGGGSLPLGGAWECRAPDDPARHDWRALPGHWFCPGGSLAAHARHSSDRDAHRTGWRHGQRHFLADSAPAPTIPDLAGRPLRGWWSLPALVDHSRRLAGRYCRAGLRLVLYVVRLSRGAMRDSSPPSQAPVGFFRRSVRWNGSSRECAGSLVRILALAECIYPHRSGNRLLCELGCRA